MASWGFDLRLRRSTASIGPKWFTQRRAISSLKVTDGKPNGDVTMPSRHAPDSSSDECGACLFEIVASRLLGPVSRHRLDDKMILASPILDHLLMRGVILSRSQPLEGHGSQPSFRGRPSVRPKGPFRALVFASPRTCTTPIRRRHTSPQTHQRWSTRTQ